MEDKGWIPWLIAALGVLWAVVKSLGGREVKRYDEGVARITEVEKTYVTRAELNTILDRREEERRRMHEENQEQLSRIETKVDKKNDEISGLAVRVAVLEHKEAAAHAR